MPMVRTIVPPLELCGWPNTCSTRARTFERVVFADFWRSDSGRLRAARRWIRLCYLRNARRDLFEQLQPFRARAIFARAKAGGVAASTRQVFDERGGHWIGDGATTTIGTEGVARCKAPPLG